MTRISLALAVGVLVGALGATVSAAPSAPKIGFNDLTPRLQKMIKKGLTGPPGLTGLKVVDEFEPPLTEPGNSDPKSLDVDCPEGTMLLSGGGGAVGNDEALITFSLPSFTDLNGPPDRWHIQAVDNPALQGDWALGATAICVDAPTP
jgi:hypothetical protein